MMATSLITLCAVCEGQSITQEAINWCPDCDEAYCFNCLKHHGIAKATRNHSVIAIEDYRELPPFIFEMKMECGVHKARYQLYCKKHECPCCIKCIDSDHKQCEDLLPLEDVVSGSKSSAALDDLEERLGDLKQFFKNIINEKEEHSTEITHTYKKFENEIRQFRIKLDKRLDELETDLLKSLIDLEKGMKKGIVIVSDKLKTNEEKTLNLLNGITSMKHHASDLQVFFAIKEIEKEVEIEEHKAEELANNEELNIQTFSLTFNSKLPNLLATTESFGKISTEYLQSKIVYQRTKQKQAQIILENSIEKDLMLTNTFRVRRENYNWCGGTLVLPNKKVLLLEVPVYLYNRKIGEIWTELDDDSCEAYLVVLNQDGSLDRKVRVSSWSYSIAAINSKTVAVTSSRHPKIVIVNLQNKSVQKTINTKYPCYGIVYFNESLVYSCGENGIEMRNLISGKVTKLKIGNKTMYEHIAIHNEKIYISECWGHNGITCYDMAGKLIWRWEDNEVLRGISDLTVDKNSYVYGIGTNSTHLVIIFPNGRQSKYVSIKDNLRMLNLRSIACCQQSNKLYVTDDFLNTRIYEIN